MTNPFDNDLANAAHHALRYFVQLDESNAAIHTAEVRYSPLTFRLAEALAPYADTFGATPEIARVLAHANTYTEDTGR